MRNTIQPLFLMVLLGCVDAYDVTCVRTTTAEPAATDVYTVTSYGNTPEAAEAAAEARCEATPTPVVCDCWAAP